MLPVASQVLELDTAIRRFETATGPLTGGARRARLRVLNAAGDLRAAAGRLAIAEAAKDLDATPGGARDALRTVLAELRRAGALPWADVIAICNDVADTIPGGRR
ncbi:hypothetical protein [Segnochrobactrum spirostomi]|uniref:Uncharacterized protein n=1 Tax=Segnochrobactrum spirostomi TaxID=2608987 RepID=A0A6A7Y4K4_9HYPH|nr:hypothetical protein [Segnochrobactrum spirostomi]MQT13665.1 hypothetical protein [Segnochrobactrum spirostomi]